MSTRYSFMGGLAQLNMEGWYTKQWEMSLFSDYKLSFHYPGFFFSSLFYLGVGTSAYIFGRSLLRFGRRVMTYFKSVSNASKYINSENPDDRSKSYSAVIYGAGTKAGRIYANYLAKKGFNLILVEREQQSLNMIQQNIRFHTMQEPMITTIVLDKFDMDTFNKTVV